MNATLEASPFSITTHGGRCHRLCAPSEREAEVAARALALRTGHPVALVDERSGERRMVEDRAVGS